MVSLIPSVSVIGPRPRSGTYAMWYGNRSVATAYRELRTTRRRCSPRTHPCSHAVSRYLFEDLPSGACVLQQNRKREPGRRRIRTYPAGMGALERSSGRGQYGLVPFNGFSLRYCPGGPVGCSRVDSTPLKPTSRGR